MGMYDYLGGNQIEVFYTPIFGKDPATDQNTVFYSGGFLRSFDYNEELPLVTLYYKYPKNFIIYNYRTERKDAEYIDVSGNIFVIKDGMLKKVIWNDQVEEKDFGDSVVDYYGRELNIKSIDDIKNIKEEFKEYEEKRITLEKELFPEGKWNVLRNNYEEYMKRKPKLEEIIKNTYGRFNKKWFKEDLYEKEKKLGELLEVLLFYIQEIAFLKEKNDIKYLQEFEAEYKECCKMTKEFLNNNKGIVDKYMEWLADKSLIWKIEKVVNGLLNEGG